MSTVIVNGTAIPPPSVMVHPYVLIRLVLAASAAEPKLYVELPKLIETALDGIDASQLTSKVSYSAVVNGVAACKKLPAIDKEDTSQFSTPYDPPALLKYLKQSCMLATLLVSQVLKGTIVTGFVSPRNAYDIVVTELTSHPDMSSVPVNLELTNISPIFVIPVVVHVSIPVGKAVL